MINFRECGEDVRRVIIVDFMSLAYLFQKIPGANLETTLNIGGKLETVSTKIPTMTIKQINRWGRNGFNHVAICFDTMGCTHCKKAYVNSLKLKKRDGTIAEYKGGRLSEDPVFYNTINVTAQLLHAAGVSTYLSPKHEADDLIKACVDVAKREYPDYPIDIITGDEDMLPLVDEQVSVFLRSTKYTYSEHPFLEKVKYIQITPDNFEFYVNERTAFKPLGVKYNTVLLAKILRGDGSDTLPPKLDWKPSDVKKLTRYLSSTGLPVDSLFRYDAPIRRVVRRDTGEDVTNDYSTIDKSLLLQVFDEPKALTKMCEVLAPFVDEDDISYIRKVYHAFNLNGSFLSDDPSLCRAPARVTPMSTYSRDMLAQEASKLRINL